MESSERERERERERESDSYQIVSTYGVHLSLALGVLVPLVFSCGFCGELEQHLGNSLLTMLVKCFVINKSFLCDAPEDSDCYVAIANI